MAPQTQFALESAAAWGPPRLAVVAIGAVLDPGSVALASLAATFVGLSGALVSLAAAFGGGVARFVTGPTVVPAVLAVGLAGVHVLARRCRVLGVIPRSRFLSFAGGVSVAYVFVHVLPELGRTERSLGGDAMPVITTAEGVYVVTMVGFVAYYGLERLARRSADEGPVDRPTRDVFWVHVGSFAAYNGIIGYLLFHRETPGLENLVLFAVAIGLHFLVNDYGLQETHEDVYLRAGRWILAGAVLVGGAVALAVEIDRGYLGLLFAFVGGGIVLNVIKEELPTERDSSFPAFGVGVVGYTALLLAM